MTAPAARAAHDCDRHSLKDLDKLPVLAGARKQRPSSGHLSDDATSGPAELPAEAAGVDEPQRLRWMQHDAARRWHAPHIQCAIIARASQQHCMDTAAMDKQRQFRVPRLRGASQQSACRQPTSVGVAPSGGRYHSVTTSCVSSGLPGAMVRARPKSAIFRAPVLEHTRMLCGCSASERWRGTQAVTRRG